MSRNSIIMALFFMVLFLGSYAFFSHTPSTPEPEETKDTTVIREGTWKGERSHKATGKVIVTETETKSTIELGDGFTFNGAPDPYISLGKQGGNIQDTAFAPLKKLKGSQLYEIPKDLRDTEFDSIIIWCKKYDIKLAVARIGSRP